MTVHGSAPAPVQRFGADDRAGAGDRAVAVLDALEERARRVGIRSVVVSDLAGELHMSTKTLYRLFPSKDSMVTAMVHRWTQRLVASRDESVSEPVSARERVRAVVHFQVDWRARFCDEFWSDLSSDHPEAWSEVVCLGEVIENGVTTWLARSVRPGLDPVFARELLVAMIERAVRPSVRGTQMSRTAAVDAAVDLWCDGALVDPDGPGD